MKGENEMAVTKAWLDERVAELDNIQKGLDELREAQRQQQRRRLFSLIVSCVVYLGLTLLIIGAIALNA